MDEERSDERIQIIFEETFNTKNEASISAMQVIKNFCGYDEPNIRMKEDGDIAQGANIYNEARRSVYLDLRQYLTDEILYEVEIKRRKKMGKKKGYSGGKKKSKE